MENCLYSKTIVPARLSEDGETPTKIHVTRENNGFAVFLCDYNGTELIKWFRSGRETAIEFAVDYARNFITKATGGEE